MQFLVPLAGRPTGHSFCRPTGHSFCRPVDHSTRAGNVVVLVAVALPMLLTIGAVLINVNWCISARTEMQSAADHASRSALLRYADTADVADEPKRVASAVGYGKSIFDQTMIGGQTRSINPSAVQLGRAVVGDAGKVFTAGATPYNSARTRAVSGDSVESLGLLLSNFVGGGSFQPEVDAVVKIKRTDIVLVTDLSRSMLFVTGGHDRLPPGGDFYGPPVSGARWFDMVSETEIFLSKIARNNGMARIGLSSVGGGMDGTTEPLFANTPARRDFPIGTLASSSAFISHLRYCQGGPLGLGTNLSAGIQAAIYQFDASDDPEADRVVILLSDGEQWFGDKTASLEPVKDSAARAASAGVTIHCIYYAGPPTGDKDLKTIARVTGGEFFSAIDAAALRNSLDRLTRLLALEFVQ